MNAAALLVTPAWLFVDRPWTVAANGDALLALTGVSVFGTTAAYLIYFRFLKTAGSTKPMLVTLLMPFGAVARGALFLDERVGTHALAGMALIVVGVATIDGRAFTVLRGRLGRAAL